LEQVVFKLLTKFAFENIIEKGKKSSLFSFYFPIQNLLGILSWSFEQSCRGLNSKQLSFLGHFQKIPFCCSKIDLKQLHFENLEKRIEKIEKSFSPPKWASASLSARSSKPAWPSSRIAVQWTGRTPHAVSRSRALANQRARLAAWPRRTGGHGRWLAG
jgi:hypothetical protein